MLRKPDSMSGLDHLALEETEEDGGAAINDWRRSQIICTEDCRVYGEAAVEQPAAGVRDSTC